MKYPRPLPDAVFDLLFFAACAIGWGLLFSFLLGCAARQPEFPEVPDAAPDQPIARRVTFKGEECVSQIPLTVRSDAGRRYEAAALLAARAWNEATGREAVRVVSGSSDAQVAILFLPCPPEYWGDRACTRLAQVVRRCKGGVYRQDVQVFTLGDDVQVVVHELGHALHADSSGDEHGHSADERSIMYAKPKVRDGARIRPADVAAFRRTWGLVWDLQ